MRGVTKSVELPFVLTGVFRTPDGRPIFGFSARWQLNRNDYGVGTDWAHSLIPNFIGEEVAIEIDVWMRPPKKKSE